MNVTDKRHRFSPGSGLGRHIRFTLLVLLVCLAAGCRSHVISVNPDDPRSPQHPYRKAELALLELAAEDVFSLEKSKDYGVIYDRYTTREFRRKINRRGFLKMTHCVESFLGEVERVDAGDRGFTRKTLENRTVDTITRSVWRTETEVEEELLFEFNGAEYQLSGLYWHADNKRFHNCMAEVTAGMIKQ